MEKDFYRDISLKSQKEMVVLLWLINRRLVTFSLFSLFFDDTKRTFQRIITTLRSAFEIVNPYTYIVYDKSKKGYCLIQLNS